MQPMMPSGAPALTAADKTVRVITSGSSFLNSREMMESMSAILKKSAFFPPPENLGGSGLYWDGNRYGKFRPTKGRVSPNT